MRTLAVINQKGGCGKTTIAIHAGAALARLGKRVLLVDMDPQAHASLGLGLDGGNERLTSYELLLDPTVTVSDTIREIQPGLCLVPGSTVLAGIEQQFAGEQGREERLARKLRALRPDAFDFVLIDCPPSVGLLTFNALVASEEALIPIDASFFAMHGLAKLLETIGVVEDEMDHRLRVHVVCNNVDMRTHFSNDLLSRAEELHGGVLLDAFVSNSVRLKEAAMRGITIFDLDAASRPALQFTALARELVDRRPLIETRGMDAWMDQLHGPRRDEHGVRFTLNAPGASEVYVAGEFPGWPTDGWPLVQEASSSTWSAVVDVPAGEYAYWFVVDGVRMRDPANRDYTRDELGRENSLLVV